VDWPIYASASAYAIHICTCERLVDWPTQIRTSRNTCACKPWPVQSVQSAAAPQPFKAMRQVVSAQCTPDQSVHTRPVARSMYPINVPDQCTRSMYPIDHRISLAAVAANHLTMCESPRVNRLAMCESPRHVCAPIRPTPLCIHSPFMEHMCTHMYTYMCHTCTHTCAHTCTHTCATHVHIHVPHMCRRPFMESIYVHIDAT